MTETETEYRYMVRVRGGQLGGYDFVRVVTVHGPSPQEAIREALAQLPSDNGLWRHDRVTVDVERVR